MDKRSKVLAVALAVAVALAIVGGVIGIIVWRTSDDSSSTTSWQSQVCDKTKMCSKNWKKKPVLLISLDGFRYTYLRRKISPAIQKLADCGSHSKGMYSSYPTVTFPNHYSIVTGLYPESHGVIGNSMWDPEIGNFSLGNAEEKDDPRWWGGEPMWNTVHKSGLRSSTYFWPGSDGSINEDRPNTWLPYDPKVPFTERVDTVLNWLTLEDNERSSFLTLYMNEPDHQCHNHGPNSTQVHDAIQNVDSMIDRLYTGLAKLDLINCVNVIIVSDHGGTTTKNFTTYDALNLTTIGMPMEGLIVYGGPVGRVQNYNNESSLTNDEIVSYISNATNQMNDTYRTYSMSEVPRRYHYRKAATRIGAVLIDPDDTYSVYPGFWLGMKGDHGYDFRYENMHALFVTQGPDIVPNVVHPIFQNIELYNFIAQLLQLDRDTLAPNNGTYGTLWSLIKGASPPVEMTNMSTTEACFDENRIKWNLCALNNTLTEDCQMQFHDNLPDPTTYKSSVPLIWTPLVGRPDSSTQWQSNETCQFQHADTPFTNDISGTPVFVQALLDETKFSWLNTTQVLDNSECTMIASGDVMGSCAMIQTDADNAMGTTLTYMSLSPVFGPIFNQKVLVYAEFFDDVILAFNGILRAQTSTFGRVITISGPIYDPDLMTADRPLAYPTDIFYVTVMCEDGKWKVDGMNLVCENMDKMLVNSFIFPNVPTRRNQAQTVNNYIFHSTARVRDIEELTGLRFFDPLPPANAVYLRTKANVNIYGTDISSLPQY